MSKDYVEAVDPLGCVCTNCGADVPVNSPSCTVCGQFVSFPNVRSAELPSEQEELTKRYELALSVAKDGGFLDTFTQFEEAVGRSAAVMNRFLGPLHTWINDNNPMFNSFFRQRAAGRVPEANDWDRYRDAAEATVNPFTYTELSYAALTLDGMGMSHYGPYSVTLREVTIASRASILEENTFKFAKTHEIVAGTSPPPGYRSDWRHRGKLAAAKLYARLPDAREPSAFAHVLMERRGHESDCDFVEVHIYGGVNRAGIASVTGPLPRRGVDAVLWKQAKKQLKALGARVEEVQ